MLLSKRGRKINVRPNDIVWLRRINPRRFLFKILSKNDEIEYYSIILENFLDLIYRKVPSAVWINDPNNARAIENKLIQLKIAKNAGFIVPKYNLTTEIQLAKLSCNHIIKSIASPPGHAFKTIKYKDELINDKSYRSSLPLSQKFVKGRQSLRVCVFGSDIIALVFESELIDTRENQNITYKIWENVSIIEEEINIFMKEAGILMGIFDFRISEDGEVNFLEVNQQGQFLYLQPLSGVDYIQKFCDFLIRAGDIRSASV